MFKRITKPSFRLKSAHTVVFSPCGSYLAHLQDSTRITLWNINERSEIAAHKLIKHESYIGFNSDSTMMFCKNGNGELVFFETLSGKIISETGRFKLNRSGGCAQFMSDDSLIDGDSNGRLMIWNTDSETESCFFEINNHMINEVVKGNNSSSYFVLVCPIDCLANLGNKGSKIFYYQEPLKINKPKYIVPNDKNFKKHRNWKSISKFCLSSDEKNIILILNKQDKLSKQTLVQQDLQSSYSNSFEFDKPNEYAWSVNSNDKFIFVVIHTNFYQHGMSSAEYQKLNNNNETEHIHVFEKEGLKRVTKIHWPEVYSVAFHPNNNGVAIAACKNSVYLDDYSVLLDL